MISHELRVTQSCLTFCDPMTIGCHTPLSMEFSGQEYGVGSRFLLQGIFQPQGSNSNLPHCRQILYHLIIELIIIVCLVVGLEDEISKHTEST